MRLPCLVDPDHYRPTLFDIAADSQAREHWLRMFRQHFASLEPRAAAAGRRAALGEVERELFTVLDDPATPLPHIHAWTALRERLLLERGLGDLYCATKAEENQRSIAVLPELLARLQSTPDTALRWRLIVAAMLAGNRFDLGSPATIDATTDTFLLEVDQVLDSTWLYDHSRALDSLVADSDRPARAVILVDNSGPDFVCGVIPLALELVRSGVAVVLAANERPSLNDVTASEATRLLADLARTDAVAAVLTDHSWVRVVSTGTGEPGIDLSDVSRELIESVEGCTLTVLVGQGRALETNWETRLSVPTLRVSTIKDRLVAERLGGRLFDCVCELRSVGQGPTRRQA